MVFILFYFSFIFTLLRKEKEKEMPLVQINETLTRIDRMAHLRNMPVVHPRSACKSISILNLEVLTIDIY